MSRHCCHVLLHKRCSALTEQSSLSNSFSFAASFSEQVVLRSKQLSTAAVGNKADAVSPNLCCHSERNTTGTGQLPYVTTCSKSGSIVCCQAPAVAGGIAEDDSSAQPYLSDSIETVKLSLSQPCSKYAWISRASI